VITFVVPTIAGRESLLSRCLWSITTQPGAFPVLVVDGDGRLGDKVNAAALAVDTPYMTVVDDDDYITPDYVASVSPFLEHVDYVGFRFLELDSGRYENECRSSAEVTVWGRRSRGPVSKGVCRTEIVRRVRFRNDYKADRRWSAHAQALIETWAFVDSALYVHDWWPTASAFVGSEAGRDVGQWPHTDVNRLTVGEPHA
jgi:hypothetical protein